MRKEVKEMPGNITSAEWEALPEQARRMIADGFVKPETIIEAWRRKWEREGPPPGFMLNLDGRLEKAPAYRPNPATIGLLELSRRDAPGVSRPLPPAPTPKASPRPSRRGPGADGDIWHICKRGESHPYAGARVRVRWLRSWGKKGPGFEAEGELVMTFAKARPGGRATLIGQIRLSDGKLLACPWSRRYLKVEILKGGERR
jgi:hypothetical protein